MNKTTLTIFSVIALVTVFLFIKPVYTNYINDLVQPIANT